MALLPNYERHSQGLPGWRVERPEWGRKWNSCPPRTVRLAMALLVTTVLHVYHWVKLLIWHIAVLQSYVFSQVYFNRFLKNDYEDNNFYWCLFKFLIHNCNKFPKICGHTPKEYCSKKRNFTTQYIAICVTLAKTCKYFYVSKWMRWYMNHTDQSIE